MQRLLKSSELQVVPKPLLVKKKKKKESVTVTESMNHCRSDVLILFSRGYANKTRKSRK